MKEFLLGAACSITILGGICGFMWYIFSSMEKRIEEKMNSFGFELHRIADELQQERRDKTNLYNFVLNSVKK